MGTNEAKSRAVGAIKGPGIFQLTCSMMFLADMDAEREALQSTAFPEVQTFCQKHGLMFEVIASSLPWCPLSLKLGNKGVPPTLSHETLCSERLPAGHAPQR